MAAPFHFDADSGALIIDDPDSLERLNRKSWSPSSSKAVHSCPARWAADKLIPGEPDPFGAAALGTAGHLVSEVLHGMPADDRTPEEAEKVLRSLWTDYRDPKHQLEFPDEADREAWESAVREKVAGLFIRERFAGQDPAAAELVAGWDAGTCNPETRRGRWHDQRKCPDCQGIADRWAVAAQEFRLDLGDDAIPDPRDVATVECERALESEVNGVPFFGRIDRTERITGDGIGGLRVVDTKTGRSSSEESRRKWGDDHGDQLRLYALAIEHADGNMPRQVEIHYSASGRVYRASLLKPHLRRVATEFRESWQEMQASYDANSYQARQSPLCGWCPLVSACPTALAKGRTDRTDNGNGSWALENGVEVRAGDPGALPPSRKAEERDTEGGIEMVAGRMFAEDKSWVETVNGRLNANSYAAQAYAGCISVATEQVVANGPGFASPREAHAQVEALAHMLYRVVAKVQMDVNGTDDAQDGLNTRLRGFLYNALGVFPVPFGATEESAWVEWVRNVRIWVEQDAHLMASLFAGEAPEKPWQVFLPSQAAEPVKARTPRRKAA